MTSPLLPAALLAEPVFDRGAALRHGVSDAAIGRALAGGSIVRVRRGWYAPRRAGGVEAAAQGYLDRGRAAARTRGLPMTALTALAAHRLPVWDVADRPVYLAGTSTGRHTRAGIVLMTPLRDDVEAVECVGVVDAILTAALVEPVMALAAADAACRSAMVAPGELASSLALLDGRRASPAAREALSRVDGRRESPGESVLAWLCHGWGLELRPQVRLETDIGAFRGDFEIVGTNVVIEFDGLAKYASRDDLVREKRREDAIRRTGRVVVRVTWADFARPGELRAHIVAALERPRRAA